jgi:hypothetical protein
LGGVAYRQSRSTPERVGWVGTDCQLIHESLSRTGGSALAHLKQQPEITGYVFHRDHWMAARAAWLYRWRGAGLSILDPYGLVR